MAVINLTLRARIFFSMLLLLLLSFLITGAISIYHFWHENEEYHEKRLKRKETTINASIDYFLGNYPSVSDDSLSFLLDEKICEWADINNMDINIYNLEGRLLISSNAILVEEGVVKAALERPFIQNLLKRESVVHKKESDSVIVLSSYKIIYDNLGGALAVVNLPYFEQNRIPERDIEFLETLISLYALLFVIAVIIAYFLSNYITSSLKTIGERLTKTQFNRENKPLVWRSNDEIGRLVQEYNRMLKELEENAITLAKTERESAWKEMAKQVAHEIKNPLTPMRLMVQHLEFTLKTEDKKELKEFTKSMIDQIDTMTNIADAFSRFAEMPDLKKERIELNEVVMRAGKLYDHLDVKVELPQEKVYALADREQLLRVFNNLIKNGWQSVPEFRSPYITVQLSVKEEYALIAVTDNGSGIEESKRSKVFEPSFTTKTQGMGLGLAMVKNIVKGFGGKIWFETEVDQGTTFFISLKQA